MHGPDPPLEPTPHLAPALTAVILGVASLMAFGVYARSLERRVILTLAAHEAIIHRDGGLFPLKNQGTALQTAAFEAGCLLPIYGSSEMTLHADYNRPFHATNLFHERPTGFAVFPIGMAGTTCLIIQQKLAAAGPVLRGRKVAISLSPFWFFERITARADRYAGNFSDLQAGELAFATGLSLRLRQDAARRMLAYPATLAKRPLLRFALENLADGSPMGLACYDAVLPLGMIHNAILRYQDHWGVLSYLWRHPERISSPIPARDGRTIDWPALYRQAEDAYRPHSDNNEFGLDNQDWIREIRPETLRKQNSRSDAEFLLGLEKNREWVDLELLLRELKEMGARPLVLSMPIHGPWYDRCGITSPGRQAYYRKLRETCARHNAPVVDFADHDDDRWFCHDAMAHLSPCGWVYYCRVLDGFFHDAVPGPCALPPPAASSPRTTGAGLVASSALRPRQEFRDPFSATARREGPSRSSP